MNDEFGDLVDDTFDEVLAILFRALEGDRDGDEIVKLTGAIMLVVARAVGDAARLGPHGAGHTDIPTEEGSEMAMIYAGNLEKAARYLVRVLNENGGRVHCAHFYDGSDETALALYSGLGVDEEEGKWMGAEGVVDQAAGEMEAQGFVRRVWLDGEKLLDGEPAYEINLTDEGRKKLAAGEWPRFRNIDL